MKQMRGTVLVVDDEPSVRGLAARVLRRRGFTVREAVDAPSALAAASAIGGVGAAYIAKPFAGNVLTLIVEGALAR